MPKGVKGSGQAVTRGGGTASAVTRSGSAHDDDALESASVFGDPHRHDRVPRCRVTGCGAMLTPGGDCPACAFRARKYAKVFAVQNPNCECGAPRVPTKPGAVRLSKRCPLCRKLHAKAKAKGIAVT